MVHVKWCVSQKNIVYIVESYFYIRNRTNNVEDSFVDSLLKKNALLDSKVNRIIQAFRSNLAMGIESSEPDPVRRCALGKLL